MKRLLSGLFTIFMIIGIFTACSSDGDTPDTQIDNTQVSSSSEVAEKDDGTEAAGSEDGAEVEISGERFTELYNEYEAVKGKDPEKEKELLAEIQIMLEAGLQ